MISHFTIYELTCMWAVFAAMSYACIELWGLFCKDNYKIWSVVFYSIAWLFIWPCVIIAVVFLWRLTAG